MRCAMSVYRPIAWFAACVLLAGCGALAGCKGDAQFSKQEIDQMKAGPPKEMPPQARQAMQGMGNASTSSTTPPRPVGQPGPGGPGRP